MKKTIAQVDPSTFAGKKVLVRVEFNVPQNSKGEITDDTRIRAAIPTINLLRKAGAKVILLSHIGAPKGKSPKFSLKPIAKRLSQLLSATGSGGRLIFAEDCIGEIAESSVAQLQPEDICLLENVRFYPEEEKNDPDFAKQLARLGEIYVDDSFGTAHRPNASTEAVTRFLRPALAGLLLDREIRMLSETLDTPVRPFATIVGGAKRISYGILDRLLTRANLIIFGGALAFTFLKARGLEVGQSFVETDQLGYCAEFEHRAREMNVQLVFPVDVVCAKEATIDAVRTTVDVHHMPPDMRGLDLGDRSVEQMASVLQGCNTILWNGPLGVFEVPGFERGTYSLIEELLKLTKNGAKVVIAGGDSTAALNAKGVKATEFTHVSTGGGASVEFIKGETLPAIACLDDA